MKKIINGKRYDTNTATECGRAYSNAAVNDFSYWEETLYQKRTGEFFLHGKGGPMTRYATQSGDNTWGWGEKIIPVSPVEARKWAEDHLDADEYEELFGECAEDDSKKVVTYSLPVSTIEKIKRLSAEHGVSLSDIVAKAVEALSEEPEFKFLTIDDTGTDQFLEVHDTLSAANESAADQWDHLTTREKKFRHIYVLDVRRSDLDDPDDWESFTGGGYCDGRFDSSDL